MGKISYSIKVKKTKKNGSQKLLKTSSLKASGMYMHNKNAVKVNKHRVKGNAELSSDFINKRARRYMNELGFAWSQVANNVVGASHVATRNGLIRAQHELLRMIYEYHDWRNATGNAITSFLSAIYDWNGNIFIRNLGEFGGFGAKEKPKFKLAPGVYHSAKMKSIGVHWGKRFKQSGTYFIKDSSLVGSGDDTPDYEKSKKLLDNAASMIPNMRAGIGSHTQSQALKFEHPIEYNPSTKGNMNLLDFANRYSKSIVRKYIFEEISHVQDAIDKGGQTRDLLGRFVKGTGLNSNVGRGAGGKFISLK